MNTAPATIQIDVQAFNALSAALQSLAKDSREPLDFLQHAQLMTESQFCRLAGFTDGTAKVKRARGEMPPHRKLGRTIVYAYSDVIAWLDAQGLQPGATDDADEAVHDAILGRRKSGSG